PVAARQRDLEGRDRVFRSGARSDPAKMTAYIESRRSVFGVEPTCRALGVETVINRPSVIGVRARLQHLPELVAKARQVNRRVLIIERAGQSCAIGSALFERIHQPYARGTNAPWLWPARFVHSSTPSPASPTKTFAGRSPDCSAPLHQRPHELRPAPPAPARTHPAPAPQQPLRPHRRGHPRRRLLPQAPQPAAATAPRRRPTTRATPHPPRPRHPPTQPGR